MNTNEVLMSDAKVVRLSGVWGERPPAFGSARVAWARMKEVLFQGGRSVRWFSIGFCAWLATFSLDGCSSMRSFGQGFTDRLKDPNGLEGLDQLQSELGNAVDKIIHFLTTPIGIAVIGGVVLCSLVLAIGLLWIRARGEFMFLHRWYHPDDTIGASWRRAAAPAWSLFLWRIGFGCVSLTVWGAWAVAAWLFVAVPFFKGGQVWSPMLLPPILLMVGGALLLAMLVAMVEELLEDFVLPVMYTQGVSVNQAWMAAFSICNQHPFGVIGFYFVKSLYGLLFAIVVLLAILLTLLIALIPLMLPFLGTVVLLPVTYFFRGYSVSYLAAWRPTLVPHP